MHQKKKKKKFCLFFFAHSLSFHNLFSKLSIEFLCFGSHVFNFRKFLFVFYFLCHILLFFSLLDAVSPLLPVAFSCLWVCSSLHSLLEAFLCSHSRAIPSFPSQLEWKIGLAWANTRGSLNSPSYLENPAVTREKPRGSPVIAR